MRRQHIGIVFQFFNLLEGMTVLENVALPAMIAGLKRKPAETRARDLLDLLGLADKAKAAPGLALRRPAPAPGHRPGPGQRAHPAARRRAHRRPRLRGRPGGPRAVPPPAPGRPDDPDGHPRRRRRRRRRAHRPHEGRQGRSTRASTPSSRADVARTALHMVPLRSRRRDHVPDHARPVDRAVGPRRWVAARRGRRRRGSARSAWRAPASPMRASSPATGSDAASGGRVGAGGARAGRGGAARAWRSSWRRAPWPAARAPATGLVGRPGRLARRRRRR